MNIIANYAPYSGGLPAEGAADTPHVNYLTSYRTAMALVSIVIKPGPNFIKEPEPKVLAWLEALEAEGHITLYPTESDKANASAVSPSEAIQIIGGMLAYVDDFVDQCKDPKVLSAATKRKKQLERLTSA